LLGLVIEEGRSLRLREISDRPMGDTILVAPGERVDVLVKADAPGPWALHCHILNHAESSQGMFGMVTAMVVE
jgi:FtsP/CotA-like multicopper oxidase with cupredoxin domain